MDLGSIIKKVRKQKGQTQEQFASLCGITQTYLSQIESNSKEPNLSTLKTISATLDVPLPILFFLSLNADDVQVGKRKDFEQLAPSVKNLINECFEI